MASIPSIALNSGATIPQFGYGVYKVAPADTERMVAAAFEVGYRHIDTASLYGNEDGVGRAIAASGIPREELFVTTKLWNDDHGRTRTLAAMDRSLERLGLDYVDLYLIHWPQPARGLFVETWLTFEELAAAGKARSIGVSNFAEHHLRAIIDASSTVPAVNQVELHPVLQQRRLRAFQEPLGIRTESWGPLGHGSYSVSDLPVLVEIADEVGATPQQVAIKWQLDEGLILFPKTSRPERLVENLASLDVVLTPEHRSRIDALDAGRRVGRDPDDDAV